VRGLFCPALFLDYLRFFVLFEDDGALVKKIAGYHQFHAVRAAIAQVIAASSPEGNHKGGVPLLIKAALHAICTQINPSASLLT
jgi:type I restriction enzyme R subunit